MSWVIKSARPFVPIWEEPNFKVGDKVRLLPWQGDAMNVDYNHVITYYGNTGEVIELEQPNTFRDAATYPTMIRVRIRGANGAFAPQYLEKI